jgi:hypothetical protein
LGIEQLGALTLTSVEASWLAQTLGRIDPRELEVLDLAALIERREAA